MSEQTSSNDLWFANIKAEIKGQDLKQYSAPAPFASRDTASVWVLQQIGEILGCSDTLPATLRNKEELEGLAQAPNKWITWSINPSRKASAWSTALPTERKQALKILNVICDADPVTAQNIESAHKLFKAGRSIVFTGLPNSAQDLIATCVGLQHPTTVVAGQFTEDLVNIARMQRHRIKECIQSSTPSLTVPSLLVDQGNTSSIISCVSVGIPCCLGVTACHGKDGMLKLMLDGNSSLPHDELQQKVKLFTRLPFTYFDVQRNDAINDGYPRITRVSNSGRKI